MKKGILRQILLITDGCSNKGEDPSATAALANEQGITVNVIGILDDYEQEDSNSLQEVEDIARSGGGISQIVHQQSLVQTVQMVTKQAMNQTLQGIVNKELQEILGSEQTLTDIEPEKRGEMIEVVEDMGEQCQLEILILIDTSASMRDKLETVKESLIDLSISLNARMGTNQFCIYSFPGRKKDTQKVFDWSTKLDALSTVFPKLTSGGVTPTGPAIREALHQFSKKSLRRSFRDEDSINEAWN